MDRNEFIIATALFLFGAFLLGFVTHWIITRLSRVSKAELGELDRMAEALHRAEEDRDAATEDLNRTEARLRNRISQAEAELQAAMEGLRDARNDAEELRAFISEQNMGPDKS